jgi:hypothetical protein
LVDVLPLEDFVTRRRSELGLGFLLFLFTCFASARPAQAGSILFLEVDSQFYHNDGLQLAAMLTAGGHTVTYRLAGTAVYNDFNAFDQVWVYDLSFAADNTANMLGNYTNLATYFNGLSAADKNVIVDGRIISSAPNWAGGAGEVAWIQNYANQLEARGGGLVLGTDHNDYHAGINTINTLMGFNLFSGFFPGPQALVDDQSPLFVAGLAACAAAPTEKCINDNSTTGFVPTGLQPNGLFLTPVAYHGTTSTAFANAAVASTIGSPTFGTDPDPIPEPATTALVVLGVGCLLSRRLRQHRGS